MTKRAHLWPFVLALGCHQHAVMMTGDDAAAPFDSVDAYHLGPCWPIDGATPGGTIEIGTGDPYVPMPDQLAIEYGPQGGFDIPARSRIEGLVPGNPNDVLDPVNPHTRLRSFFIDAADDAGAPNTPTTCGFTLWYIPDPAEGGAYILPTDNMIVWDTSFGPSDLFGKQFLVVAEVIDSTGKYAMAEKVITALPPPGWYQDAGP